VKELFQGRRFGFAPRPLLAFIAVGLGIGVTLTDLMAYFAWGGRDTNGYVVVAFWLASATAAVAALAAFTALAESVDVLDDERGLALLVDDVARAARSVEEEEQRDVLGARREVGGFDALAVVEHLEVYLGEAGDAPASRVRDEEGDGHQVRADADDLVRLVLRGCGRRAELKEEG